MQTVNVEHTARRSRKPPYAIFMSGSTNPSSSTDDPIGIDGTGSENTTPQPIVKNNPFVPQGNGAQDTPIVKP
jgi:hypothetical protein